MCVRAWKIFCEKGALTYLLGTKFIQRCQENRQGGVDAHHPRESQQVVCVRNQHWQLDQDYKWTQHSFGEGISQVSRVPLLNANDPQDSRPALRLLTGRQLAIIVRLIEKGKDGSDANTRHDSIETKCPLPFLRVDDECGEEGAEVGREDDEGSPDVDFASVLVEEEHVFDEHETTL